MNRSIRALRFDPITRTRSIALAAAVAASLATAATAGAQSPTFTDWMDRDAGGASGSLLGGSVSLAGAVTGGSTLDGSYPGWDLDHFTPRLKHSDALEIQGLNGHSYTLTFASPVHDPVLHLGSLASRIELPAGTTMTKVSGQESLIVRDSTVSGVAADRAPDGTTDSNGTVRLTGAFTSLSFTVTPTFGGGHTTDGIYLQVGGSSPPPEPTPTPPPPPAATAPDTFITSGPAEGSATREPAVFEFNSDAPGARFECSLETGRTRQSEGGAPWEPCTSPYRQPQTGETDLLLFSVRAIDQAGNADPTPAARRYWFDPPAYGNFRIRGIDVFQLVQPNAGAKMYRYDPETPQFTAPFRVSCGAGTPTSYVFFGGRCETSEPQNVGYQGVPLDVRKLTTAIVYVGMEGLANEDPEQLLEVTLTARDAETGRRVGPVLRRQITNPPPSSTPWVTAAERGNAELLRHGVQFTFDASWLNRSRYITLVAEVDFVAGKLRECIYEDCSPDNTMFLRQVPVDRTTQPAQLLIQPLALRTRENEAFPTPESVFGVVRHLFPGGERVRLRWYPGVIDVIDEAQINPGDPRCGMGNTTVRTCRWNAIGTRVNEWIAENAPRFENADGDIVQAYDMVMGLHDYSTSNSTAADLAPGGTPQGTFTEPGWWWAGTVRDVQPRAFTNVPRFTAAYRVRPITALAHELGHALTLPHMNIANPPPTAELQNPTCSGGSRGEDWLDDRMGRLQSTKFDARSPGDDEPQPDGLTTLYDLMSYCSDNRDSGAADTPGTSGNAWISARNWNRLFSELTLLARRVGTADRPRAVPAAGAAAARSLMAVGPGFAVGVAGPDGGHILRVAQPDGNDAVPPPVPSSPVRLRSLAAGGQVLLEAGVRVDVSSEAGPGEPGTFVGPVAVGATAVELVRDGKVLHRLERSQVPRVELLAPGRGARVSGRKDLTVRWRAGDPDGGKLEAAVDYSTDGGRTWRTAFQGPDTGSTTIAAGSLAGSRQARVRVTVNDGFAEASARSAQFRVDGVRPTIAIVRPQAGERLSAQVRTLLIASASDDAGQPLGGRRITWFAGRRRLGTGSELHARLPAGRFVLRAVARDAAGRRAVARRRVQVAAEPRRRRGRGGA